MNDDIVGTFNREMSKRNIPISCTWGSSLSNNMFETFDILLKSYFGFGDFFTIHKHARYYKILNNFQVTDNGKIMEHGLKKVDNALLVKKLKSI